MTMGWLVLLGVRESWRDLVILRRLRTQYGRLRYLVAMYLAGAIFVADVVAKIALFDSAIDGYFGYRSIQGLRGTGLELLIKHFFLLLNQQ